MMCGRESAGEKTGLLASFVLFPGQDKNRNTLLVPTPFPPPGGLEPLRTPGQAGPRGQRWAAAVCLPRGLGQSRARKGLGLGIRKDQKTAGPEFPAELKVGGLDAQSSSSLPPPGAGQQHPSPARALPDPGPRARRAHWRGRVTWRYWAGRARGRDRGRDRGRARARARAGEPRGRSGANFGGVGGGGRGEGEGWDLDSGGGEGSGGKGGWEARQEGEGPRRAQKNDNARKISIFALHKLMTMSSFLINSNYIEPKFPPFEEYAQHSGPGGRDGGPGGGPGYQQPPVPAAQHLPQQQQPQLPHAGGSRESAASYYAQRAAREASYPAAALYPAHGAADTAYPYDYRGSASPGRPPQPEQPPAHAKGPAHGLHASHVMPPGRQPPPPSPPQHRAAASAPPRRCEAAPATPGVPAGGSAPACPLLLGDKSPLGLKGKEPVVYPWMKKIHVSAGTWRRWGGAGGWAGTEPRFQGRGGGRGERPRGWGPREGSPQLALATVRCGCVRASQPPDPNVRILLYPGSLYREIYETPNC